ncbi:MAG: hypothetical protein ACK4PG_11110 [Acetobacteraceae bacterium]
MSTNYAAIPPVGQIDGMSCWAACLTWWLKAVKDGRPDWNQLKIISEYDKHTDESGGFPPAKILEVWPADARLKISGATFKSQSYWGRGLPIGDKPAIIAFRHPQAGTHMNVVFDQRGRMVKAMEPYHPFPGQDGKRTGQILDRSVDFYVLDNYDKSREFILFWPSFKPSS